MHQGLRCRFKTLTWVGVAVQADTAAAQSALSEQAAYVSELERACQSLRQQLDTALAQHEAAHSAVGAAADRLQQLADGREALERALQQAQQEAACAVEAAAARATELERQGQELAGLLRKVAAAEAERDRVAAELQQFMGHNAELQEALQVGRRRVGRVGRQAGGQAGG